MKKIIIVALTFLLISVSSFAEPFVRTEHGVSIKVNSINVEIQFYGSSIVRVIKSPQGKNVEKESLSVVKIPEKVNFNILQSKDELLIKNKSVEVVISLENGKVTFKNTKGDIFLVEKENGSSFTDFDDAGVKTYSVSQSYILEQDEAIYGLGILQNGKMSQRNQEVRMVQNNTWDFVTFFQSVKGYGLFWDNYSPTTFKDNAMETSFSSEVGECIDYYFMYGGNSDGVIAEMRDLTGQVPMFPLWTYGYWQSKERYKSQNETVGVVKKYRELGVPIDGIIQDWQYWGNNYLWNSMEFLNEDFPNPKAMINDIHEMNAHIIISIWSSFGPATKQYRELEKIGALYNFNTWPESGLTAWPPNMEYPSGVRVYDAFNPKARDIYWKHLNEGLFKLGIDGWWMDSTEPDHLSFKPEDMNNQTALGSFRKVRNAYPLVTVGGVYENQRAVNSDKRVFILTRSGFAGQQRYGANVWSGDVFTSWENFRNQIPAGLNFSMCGIPHWNSDIGGFFAGEYNKTWNDGTASKNPMFQELYVRWMQFGAFNPMMRSHGTDLSREIYHFGQKGEPIYDAIESTIRLRYSLLPYIYSTSWEVTDKQSSFMRALVMDFSHDKNVWDIKHQYMFGKSILVAPVIEAQYTPEKIKDDKTGDGWTRSDGDGAEKEPSVDFTLKKNTMIYLPSGSDWYDFWTNEIFKGGNEISKETSIDIIPLYIKAGSILPIGPEVQYATEKNWDNLELRIYEGADGTFTLYEDENDNYNYEKGIYSTITFSWNDTKRTLTINNREGSFPGMLTDRKFNIVRIGKNQTNYKTVNYAGKKMVIKF
ncbi:MAG: glycoside hydrolase family 31 protein [Fermentimonas sp.]|jgi:alpha-D-xyloside xylohydrolase|nr:glycoside hydrolase family 31 protein [Fermentimonas sp.]MDD2930932.1 glycoside hydrolase family 31 protein [Fermentimonas sp.]MDD3188854.1 glycoside hydrolase family 31 protein [Fermentimonas sp.]MDD4284657.1 glycoside hydrolase family 31 protein [Fermentimonas sp.]MDD4724569.1 glycoside hydrolase family 31 protein [Fermentimonas sp.]